MATIMPYFIKALQWIFQNIFIINIFLAILLVFFERRNPTITWFWLMVFIFLPGVGFILYLFFGQDMRKKKIFKVKEEEDKYIHSIVNSQERLIQQEELVFNDPMVKDYVDIIQLHLNSSGAVYTQDNSVEVYYTGEEKFNAFMESIKGAKDFIHIQYYIIRDDDLGNKVINLLTDKVKEGVEVKLLYDGMGCRGLSKRFFKDFMDAGGKVACFFPPVFRYVNMRPNYRNHRKICVIDGIEGYVGGFNIGDEYIKFTKKFGFWRDTHCKIRGSAVHSLEWRFLLDWRFAAKEELEISDRYILKKSPQGSTGIQIVSSGPDSKWSNIKDGYFKMITNATKKIYIQTPYFIPDDAILEAVRIAALSGVDVRVIIPNKPDHPFVYWASFSYIGELLEAGVKFYAYEKGFVHSKLILMDDVVTSLGSANLDIRSFKLDFEVNAFIYDKDVNKRIEEQFIEDLSYSREIDKEFYENRSYWIRIKESISRLLSPIL